MATTESKSEGLVLNKLTGHVNKSRTRVGRGASAGKGRTCGKGQKGQSTRTGSKTMRRYEGGQMPLQMRLPKFGFSSRTNNNAVKLACRALNKLSADTDQVSIATLIESKLVNRNTNKVKIYLAGTIERALKITDGRIVLSKGALENLKAAGGSIDITVAAPLPVKKKKSAAAKAKSESVDDSSNTTSTS